MLDFIVVSAEVTCLLLASLGLSRSIVKIKDDRERWELEQPERAERELDRSRAEAERLRKLDEERIRSEDDARVERLKKEELKFKLESSPGSALRKQIEALGKRRDTVTEEISRHRNSDRPIMVSSCERELEQNLKLSEQYMKTLIDIEMNQPDEHLRAVGRPDDRSPTPVQQTRGEDVRRDGAAPGDSVP